MKKNNLKNYLEELVPTYRAGVIPYVKEEDKYYIALMKPSDPAYGGDKFQICKGRIEEGDDAKITAVKECFQELGLDVSNFTLKILWNNNKITWFYCEVDKRSELVPGPNENGIIESEEAKWFEIDEALGLMREWQQPIVQMLKRRLGI